MALILRADVDRHEESSDSVILRRKDLQHMVVLRRNPIGDLAGLYLDFEALWVMHLQRQEEAGNGKALSIEIICNGGGEEGIDCRALLHIKAECNRMASC